MIDISLLLKQISYIFSNIFFFLLSIKIIYNFKVLLAIQDYFIINFIINFQNLPMVVMTTME